MCESAFQDTAPPVDPLDEKVRRAKTSLLDDFRNLERMLAFNEDSMLATVRNFLVITKVPVEMHAGIIAGAEKVSRELRANITTITRVRGELECGTESFHSLIEATAAMNRIRALIDVAREVGGV